MIDSWKNEKQIKEKKEMLATKSFQNMLYY